MGGVGVVLVWVAWVAFLRGQRVNVSRMLARVACLRGCHACVGGVGGMLAWVAY